MSTPIAQIHTGAVYLKNAFCGRSWSLVRGTTEELWQGGERAEWLVARSPEFHLEVDGVACAALDCTSVVWSELAGPDWAAVTAAYHFSGIRVDLSTRLYGGVNVFERTLSVLNAGADPVLVTRFATEILPVPPGAVQLGAVDGEAAAALAEETDYDAFQVIRKDGQGLLLGREAGAAFFLFEPNPMYCAIAGAGSVPIAPAESCVLQRTLTAAFSGSLSRAAGHMADYWRKRTEAGNGTS